MEEHFCSGENCITRNEFRMERWQKGNLIPAPFCRRPGLSIFNSIYELASVNKQISECVAVIINKQVSVCVGDMYLNINMYLQLFVHRSPCFPFGHQLPKINAQINCQSLQRNQQANILRIFCSTFCQLIHFLPLSPSCTRAGWGECVGVR